MIRIAGFSQSTAATDEHGSAEHPEDGVDRADRAAAVERQHGNQVEEVEEEADVGQRHQQVRVHCGTQAPAGGRAE